MKKEFVVITVLILLLSSLVSCAPVPAPQETELIPTDAPATSVPDEADKTAYITARDAWEKLENAYQDPEADHHDVLEVMYEGIKEEKAKISALREEIAARLPQT